MRDLFVDRPGQPSSVADAEARSAGRSSILGLVWLIGFDLWIFFRTDVVFFFYAGGLLRMYKAPLEISARVAVCCC